LKPTLSISRFLALAAWRYLWRLTWRNKLAARWRRAAGGGARTFSGGGVAVRRFFLRYFAFGLLWPSLMNIE